MPVFALIHGAWHGAWCWERVAAELEARGHRAIAVDLPASDPEATFSDYARRVAEVLADEPEDVRLVAHSMGCMSAPLVAELRPVAEIAMVCGVIPEPGRSYYERVADGEQIHPAALGPGLGKDELGRTHWVDEAAAVRDLYADCDPAVAAAAVRQLRPQSTAPYQEPCPLDSLPEVRFRYLLCRDDRIVAAHWARAAAQSRLGVEATEWDGSHSPMLSQPERLTDWLTDPGA